MMPGPGDIRDVAQPCAEVLVRLGKAEYITVRRPAGQKKKRDAEHGECGTFYGEPEKNQKSGRDVREAGWTSLFQAVAEPFCRRLAAGCESRSGKLSSPFMRCFLAFR